MKQLQSPIIVRCKKWYIPLLMIVLDTDLEDKVSLTAVLQEPTYIKHKGFRCDNQNLY